MNYRGSIPVISTSNMLETLHYYTAVLGFQQYFVYGEPPVYAGVQHDDVELYITLDEKLAATLKAADVHPEIFLWVEDANAMFAEHRSRGAKIIEPIADRPWDARQYVIEDPNGYFLKVAEPIETDKG
jgi:uncharacterized glyoxalase superfamily protein PhnB